jgi:hypothetical protein
MTASRDEFCTATLRAILTAQADRDELDNTIRTLTRALATEHSIPASLPADRVRHVRRDVPPACQRVQAGFSLTGDIWGRLASCLDSDIRSSRLPLFKEHNQRGLKWQILHP